MFTAKEKEKITKAFIEEYKEKDSEWYALFAIFNLGDVLYKTNSKAYLIYKEMFDVLEIAKRIDVLKNKMSEEVKELLKDMK